MSVASFIKDLESDNSRLAKEAVVKRAVAANTEESRIFLKCAQLAYDPYSKWGVKQVKETSGQTETLENAWLAFFFLLDDLKHRKLTGNAARDNIEKVSKLFSDDDWNLVCRRVLIKDLRAGITSTTLNKFVPEEFKIKLFGCQLAVDGKNSISELNGRFRLEHKLDGVRMLAIVEDGVVTLTSRNGKDLENFPQIAAAIESAQDSFAQLFPNGFVLDGEVMGESFQSLMKQARRKREVETSNMVYHVFDIIDLAEFQTGKWSKSQESRSELLETLKPVLEATNTMKVSDGIYVDLSTSEGHDTLHDYFAKAVAAGLEGIMIKDVSAGYETKRTEAWLKKKPTMTLDLTVVGVEEGTGRNEGRLGALVCEGFDDEDRLVQVNVGSGYSDELRNDIWANKNEMIGLVVEVMADAVTQAQDGSYSMRFPRFVRFRGFEAGEKI